MKLFTMTTLEKAVHYKNEAIKFSNLIKSTVPQQLEKFVGQKIVKQDFTLLEKVRKEVSIPDFTPTPINGGFATLHFCNFRITEYDLMIKFSICFNGGRYEDKTYYCHYEDATIYLFSMQGQTLKEKYQFEDEKTINYSVELETIIAYKKAIKEAETLKDKIRVPEDSYRHNYDFLTK